MKNEKQKNTEIILDGGNKEELKELNEEIVTPETETLPEGINEELDALNDEENSIIPLSEIGEFDDGNFNIREDIKGKDEIGPYIEIEGVKYYDSETRSKIEHGKDEKGDYMLVNGKKYYEDEYLNWAEAFLGLGYDIGKDEEKGTYFVFGKMNGSLLEYGTKYFQDGTILNDGEYVEGKDEVSPEGDNENFVLEHGVIPLSEIGEFDDEGKFMINEDIEKGEDEIGSYIVLKGKKYYNSSSTSENFEGLGYYLKKSYYSETGTSLFGFESHDANSLYIGYIRGGNANGTGTKYFPTGSLFCGEWENGYSIKGKYIYHDGTIYEGDWKNNMREGYGKCVYNDGSIHEGDRKNDMRDGHGTYTFKNKTSIEGEWSNGIFMEGLGKIIYNNGKIYVGDILLDERNNPKPFRELYGEYMKKNGKNIHCKECMDMEENMVRPLKGTIYDSEEEIERESKGENNINKHTYIMTKGSVDDKWSITEEGTSFITMFGDKKPNEKRDDERGTIKVTIDYYPDKVDYYLISRHRKDWDPNYDFYHVELKGNQYQFINNSGTSISIEQTESFGDKEVFHIMNLINKLIYEYRKWNEQYGFGSLGDNLGVRSVIHSNTSISDYDMNFPQVDGFTIVNTSILEQSIKKVVGGCSWRLLENVPMHFGGISAEVIASWLNEILGGYALRKTGDFIKY